MINAGTAPPGARPGQRARPPRRGLLGPGAARKLRRGSLNGIGLIVALATLFPIFWMVSTAFKPEQQVLTLNPHPLPTHPTIGNFITAISASGTGGTPFWMFLGNSLIVTLSTVVLAAVVSLLASVAVARFRFTFRTSYLIMLLIVQMLPAQALVIPMYLNFRGLGLLDSLTGLILVYTASALPISIWMLRNFVATVPRELEEAAAVDGASPARVFWRILFPLVAPGLIATSIFSFIFAWNEFVYALTFIGTDLSHSTLPLYVNYFYGKGSADWGAIMAASTLFTIPPVAFFLMVQRHMAAGLTAGAVKG